MSYTFRYGIILITVLAHFVNYDLRAQTIAEKKASLSDIPGDLDKDSEKFLTEVNRELTEDQETLKSLYRKAWILHQNGASDGEFQELLGKIQEVKENIELLENSWRELASAGDSQEPYALWHQPETTLGQLVIDYGAEDYVYLIPKEVGQIPLSIGSNLPIPRAAWSGMLEQIIAQNGVGVRQLNPFLRELYLLKNDKSAIRLITNKRGDLSALGPHIRIAYVLSPEPSEVRRTFFFLDNFVNRENSIVQLVGRDILLIGEVQEIQDLLKLSDFVGQNRGDITWRAVSLSRITPDEMTKILSAIFNPTVEKDKMFPLRDNKKNGPVAPADGNGLKVIKLAPPASGLFLVGTSEEVKKAENVIRDVEGQVGGAKEKVIHWYTSKYSDPEELADVLYRIYDLMVQSGTKSLNGSPQDIVDQANQFANQDNANTTNITVEDNPNVGEFFPPDNYFEGGFPINPAPVRPAESRGPRKTSNRANFIVDQKTSSIVMVVEGDILPSLKDLIKRLDVPKKMVQIEVLLFEKRITNINEFGLNLLRMGSCATNTHKTCALFNDTTLANPLPGIFDFIIFREKSSVFPAFDMIYRFLLSQEGVSINSNPSVVTVNQTPAFIAIQEEQSIDTGTFQLEEVNVVALKAFRRAQYGTTIKITPTIHTKGEKEPYDSITLESDITFDTVRNNNNDRPNVIRRNIKNEARVADGETIILGGLRRKDTEDFKDSIPFIGEIPGLGKLFSLNRINDTSTEMFIFITPKIIRDPACDLESIRQEEMCRRPGDLPEFMCCLVQAQREEKERLFEHTLTMLLGRREERLYSPCWHNDDTCQYPSGEYDGR